MNMSKKKTSKEKIIATSTGGGDDFSPSISPNLTMTKLEIVVEAYRKTISEFKKAINKIMKGSE